MNTKTFKATLTEGKSRKLTLRLFLNREDKIKFILERGEQPEGMIKIVVI